MKKLMFLLLLAGAGFSVNATTKTTKVSEPTCNYVIVYPCPGNPIITGCFETYDQAAQYLALNPSVNCP